VVVINNVDVLVTGEKGTSTTVVPVVKSVTVSVTVVKIAGAVEMARRTKPLWGHDDREIVVVDGTEFVTVVDTSTVTTNMLGSPVVLVMVFTIGLVTVVISVMVDTGVMMVVLSGVVLGGVVLGAVVLGGVVLGAVVLGGVVLGAVVLGGVVLGVVVILGVVGVVVILGVVVVPRVAVVLGVVVITNGAMTVDDTVIGVGLRVVRVSVIPALVNVTATGARLVTTTGTTLVCANSA
jgi:hypothetical protein